MKESYFSLLYLFNEYSLRAYYVPGTVLGIVDTTRNKWRRPQPSWSLHSSAYKNSMSTDVENKRMDTKGGKWRWGRG